MLPLTILTNLFLVTTAVLAAPAPASPNPKDSGLARRVARRTGGGPFPLKDNVIASTHGTNASHIEYNDAWAGAVLSASKATYKSVTGSFVVPTPKTPSGGSSSTTYWASAWVGIDGYGCGEGLWQSGLDMSVTGSSVAFYPWYEWYPAGTSDFSGLTFTAGQTAKITVTATSLTSGTAVIQNVSTGKSVSISTSSSYALCEESAEWIMENFYPPLANFGTIAFTSASATTLSGTSVGPSGGGADLLGVEVDGTVHTTVSDSSSGVTITYV